LDFLKIIERKKRGEALDPAELSSLVEEFTADRLPPYQMAAFFMAVWFQGMTPQETVALTDSMLRSGSQLDLARLGGPTADKHSTGGVGDKVSILLAPLVAECGLYVPMLSGRGLGHTGGTLDKLEAIPGYQIHLPNARFLDVVAEVGCAIVGQSRDSAPADGQMYALRDVTGTVDCVPLITSSILSKKLAAGPETIVIDLKTGSGAFMSELVQAQALAESLIATTAHWRRRMSVVFSDMSQPLGRAVGHANETIEALAALRGGGHDDAPRDLVELTEQLAVEMIRTAGLISDPAEALTTLREAWKSGRAMQRAQRWIEAQSGRIDPSREDFGLTVAPPSQDVLAPRPGTISNIRCREIGLALADLGGARRRVEETIDLAVGLDFHVAVGEKVVRNQPLVTLYSRDRETSAVAAERIVAAVDIADGPVASQPLILGCLRSNA
jgi:pyrimidine-nucleoside phosphorylase